MLYIFKRSGIQMKTFCQNFSFLVFICIEKALLMRSGEPFFVNGKKFLFVHRV